MWGWRRKDRGRIEASPNLIHPDPLEAARRKSQRQRSAAEARLLQEMAQQSAAYHHQMMTTGTGAILAQKVGINWEEDSLAPKVDPEPSETLVGECVVGWRFWVAMAEADMMTARHLAEIALEHPFDWPERALEPRLYPQNVGFGAWEPRKRAEAICNGFGGASPGSFGAITAAAKAALGDYEHDAPHPDCGCGFWAFKDEGNARRHWGRREGVVTCFGEVNLWGKIVETEHGYRAQYAYPKRLIIRDEQMADRLAKTYGVPVEVEGKGEE